MVQTKKIRVSALTVFLALVMLLLAACNGGTTSQTPQATPTAAPAATQGNETEEPGEEAGTDDGMPAVGDFSEKIKLKWYMCTDGTGYVEDNPVVAVLNEKFNVEMSTLMINGFDNDKMNVTLASGDIPDVLIRWGTQDYYKDGIIRSFEKSWMEKYMPQSYTIMDSYGDSAWIFSYGASDGALIGIPNLSVTGDMVHTAAIREDWLEAVGLPMPTTIDELTEVLRAFTFNDPDGNGKNDTYGISIPGLHNNLLYAAGPMVFGAYGIIPTYWTLDGNGEVSVGMVQDGYKEALKQLAAWNAEGLIDPDWVTRDNGTYGNLFSNGVVGMLGYCNPGYMNYSNPTSLPSLAIANNPNAKITYMQPLTGPSGLAGGSSDGVAGSWVMSFGAKASDAQVARAMQIAEATNMDKEQFELTYFGIEGTTFQRNEDGSNAQISGIVPQEYGAQVYRTACLLTWDNAALANPKAVVDLMQESATYPALRNVISSSQVSGTYDEMDVDTAEMTKLTTEFFYNAVTGAIDIDAQWDEYVQKWMDLGGKVQTEGARTLPIIYTNK